ncbi:hypothetical protein DLH72_00575 [Candidatus Gracilibacteria bacterium]|nr:MAG: hypothetical protein DLH72_00575 [Candidatus Gracilibacteria bacterium]
MMEEKISKIIRNNAVSSYLMFGISWMFLFQRKNENLNNDFVKKHTRSALLIHLLIVISIIIFGFYGVLGKVFIWKYSLSSIILALILIFLFIVLFFGAYKAYKGEIFKIGEIFSIKKGKNVLDVNKDGNFGEKDKLTFVLSYIPFVGQIFTSKYNKNENIKEILKLNTFISFIFCFLFINYYHNLNQIIILLYFIFIAFVGVNLFGKSELIILNLSKYLDFGEIIKLLKILIKYLKNYISGNFKEFKILEQEQNKLDYEDKIKTFNEVKDLHELKGPKKIIYFPIVNLIFLFFKENKYKIHIRNGLTITFLLIITIILIIFKIIGGNILILFLFPICFGIGNLEKLYYKMPFIYEIYEFFAKIKGFFKKSKKVISEKRKEVKELKIKVGQEKDLEKNEKETKQTLDN